MAMPEALFVRGDEGGGRGRPVPPQQDTCARREAEVCPETGEGVPTFWTKGQGRGLRHQGQGNTRQLPDNPTTLCAIRPPSGAGDVGDWKTGGELRSPPAKHGSTPSGPHVCDTRQLPETVHRRGGADPRPKTSVAHAPTRCRGPPHHPFGAARPAIRGNTSTLVN